MEMSLNQARLETSSHAPQNLAPGQYPQVYYPPPTQQTQNKKQPEREKRVQISQDFNSKLYIITEIIF